MTLDSVCSFLEIEHISLLKIDVEGAEPLVLKGASHLLEKKRIHSILLEFIVEFMEDFGEDPNQLVRLLLDSGFALYEILPSGDISKITDPLSIVERRRVAVDEPQRPFHKINLVAKLEKCFLK